MTSTDTFRAQFGQALATLKRQLPEARIFVSSLPDIYQLWKVLHPNRVARTVWATARICPSMLGATRTRGSAPAGRRPRGRLQPDPGPGLPPVRRHLPMGRRCDLQLQVQCQPGQHPGLLPPRSRRAGGPGQRHLGRVLVAHDLAHAPRNRAVRHPRATLARRYFQLRTRGGLELGFRRSDGA
jgi:hypothetical protein